MNMDETAICLFQGGGKGNVFLAKTDPAAVQNIPRGRRRAYITHVAFICDNPAIQAVLPQVLIANEHTLKAGQFAALRSACPPNVWLLRRKSAWVDGPLCAWIVRRLAAALAPYMADFQPLLLFDAARPHVPYVVFDACARVGVWPILVPAKMTWLLQPLDTHAFLIYKIYLQKAYQAARVRAACGDINLAELLPCVYDAIDSVLVGRPWAAAFDDDGFSPGQAGVSQRVSVKLHIVAPPASTIRPTLEQLRCCFPRRTRVPASAIWRPFAHPVVMASAAAAGPVAGPAAEPVARACAPPALRRSARVAARVAPAEACRDAPCSSPPVAPVATGAGSSSSTPAKAAAAVPTAKPSPRAGGIMTRSRTRALADS